MLPDNPLQRVGRRVPQGRLPDGEWLPLVRWCTLAPQPGALPGKMLHKVALELVRSAAEAEPNVLVADMARWSAYAAGAPQVRLEHLRFAVADDGRVLVRGTPLPPISGERFVEGDRIAVPCGYTRPGQELRDVTIELTRPATVRGRVIDSKGQPVAHREVRAAAADKLENRYYDPATTTNDNGYFELRFVRPGKQLIQAAPFWLDPDEAPAGASQTVTVIADEVSADVELKVKDPSQ